VRLARRSTGAGVVARAVCGKRAAGHGGDVAGQGRRGCRSGAGGRDAILAGRAGAGEAQVAQEGEAGITSRDGLRGRNRNEDGALGPVLEARSGLYVLGATDGNYSWLLIWRRGCGKKKMSRVGFLLKMQLAFVCNSMRH
jgi:hypothetical protein